MMQDELRVPVLGWHSFWDVHHVRAVHARESAAERLGATWRISKDTRFISRLKEGDPKKKKGGTQSI